jgi:hypothetical protein
MKSKLDAGLLIFVALLGFRPTLLLADEQNKTPTDTSKTRKEIAVEAKAVGVQRVFEIKYVDVETLAEVLKIFPGYIKSDRGLRLIGVSCPAEVIGSIEDTINRIDVPSKNIEITVYMLSASEKAGESSGIPLEIQGAIKQLRGVFNYQSYRLLETAVFPCQNKRDTMVSGNISFLPPNPQTKRYTLLVSASIVSDDKGRLIRLDSFVLKQRIVTPEDKFVEDSLLNTSINVREGQKVVVGKASLGGTNDALILVVTAKVLD